MACRQPQGRSGASRLLDRPSRRMVSTCATQSTSALNNPGRLAIGPLDLLKDGSSAGVRHPSTFVLESEPPPTFAHMPRPKSSKARLGPSIWVNSNLRVGLTIPSTQSVPPCYQFSIQYIRLAPIRRPTYQQPQSAVVCDYTDPNPWRDLRGGISSLLMRPCPGVENLHDGFVIGKAPSTETRALRLCWSIVLGRRGVRLAATVVSYH
jgi:hypothetical protein